MDDILYYILLAIGYALYSWLTRKRMPRPDMEAPPSGKSQETAPRQLTFEELLREITQAKQQETSAEKDVLDYEEEIENEAQSQEELAPAKEVVQFYETYEEAKRLAFERPSLEETLKLEDTKVTFGRFSEFNLAQSRNLLKEYTADLYDPEGLKKAVILSEVLNRKYF